VSDPREPDYCARCGAAYEPDQEYCLECGARLPTNRGLGGYLAARWQRRFAWYPGDWIWPVLLFFVLAAAATAAAVAVGSTRKRSSPTLVATGVNVTVGPGATQGRIVASTGLSTLPTAPSPTITTGPLPTPPGARSTKGSTTPVPTNPNALAEWPAGKSGWTNVLESLPVARGRTAAQSRARVAKEKGLPEVGVIVSSQFPSLHPGYFVVFSGIYGSQSEATAALAGAHSHGFPDAYQTEVTR
jgi:hypothetical protein